jgi:hypothetical protein
LSSVNTGGRFSARAATASSKLPVSRRTKSCPRPSACQLDTRPGERGDAFGHVEAGRQQLVVGDVPGYQPDAFGLLGVNVATGQHDLERP